MILENDLARFNNKQKTFRNRIRPALKHWIAIILLILMHNGLQAADTVKKAKVDTVKYWKTNALFGLHFNQLSLTNWASGGESSVSGKAQIEYKTRFRKEKRSFEFQHKSTFGVVGYGTERIEKTEDRLDFSVSYSYRARENWTYTSMITFKTQFANGYKYPNDSTLISGFMAPGYLTASLGFKRLKTDKFELFLSPASGKFTFVTIQELADKGAFGLEKAVFDSTGAVIRQGQNILPEFGINVLANYNHTVSENIDVTSSLNLYNNYLDTDENNRWNIDVDWETKINFNVNKHIQTVFFLLLKYDHDIKIPVYEMVEGDKKQVGEGPRLQIKESLGIGLTYKLS